MKLLKKLYSIWSPSKKEANMRQFLIAYCSRIPGTTVKTDATGNIYITKGKASTYPCIVAHMDQVQRLHPQDFKAIETDEIILGYSNKERTQCGLGADDKNGIWIALKCLMKYPNLKAAFFVGEEIGCIGSSQCEMQFFDDCRFVLQCDRRGKSDLIVNIGGTELCSPEFLEAIDFDKYKYSMTDGLSTDVCELKERDLKVCCLNMSCGYYNPHTDEEITNKKDLYNCLHFVQHIIEKCTHVYSHEYVYTYGKDFYTHGYNSTRGYIRQSEYDELYDEVYSILEANPEMTAKELKEFYHDFYPSLTDSDYTEMVEEITDDINYFRTPKTK